MIEPTDEMREAFERAYDAAAATDGFNFREDAEIQFDAGLAAVLAIVERDRKAQIAEAAAKQEPTQEMLDAYSDVAPSGLVSVWGVMAVLAIAERDLIARVEGKRDTGLCDCACDSEPISPRTGLPMEHHCDCRAVTTAGVLLGDRRKTRHVAECTCDWDEP